MPPAETVDIRPRLILPTLAARDRSSAFRELVSALVARGLIPTDLEETVLTSLEAREKKLTTAIGHGIALPHASIPRLPEAVTALGRTVGGIEAEAPDGAPVHLFYLVLVPAEEYALHLRTVAAVTRFFRTPDLHARLHAATDEAALAAVFAS